MESWNNWCRISYGHLASCLSPVKDPYAWVGYLAMSIAALCYIPQIAKIRKTQSSKDISFWMFFLWIMGSTVWITFGIRTQKMPVILTNVLNLVFRIWILCYKYITDQKNLKNTTDKDR
jgi:MtN3 and saliva related transmembrane protein